MHAGVLGEGDSFIDDTCQSVARRKIRIAILSDLHLAGDRPVISPPRADVVVLAGDIDDGRLGIVWANETFDRPVVYVLGNHEFRGSSISARLEECKAAAADHVHVLEQEGVTLHGIRFLGATLWSDCALFGKQEQEWHQSLAAEKCADYRLIQSSSGGALTVAEIAEINLCTRQWLERELSEPFYPTIVVTHHAPSSLSLPLRLFSAPIVATYASNLQELMGCASLWIHGHIHSSSDYEINGTRVVCNPRGSSPGTGYASNSRFDPNFVVSISCN